MRHRHPRLAAIGALSLVFVAAVEPGDSLFQPAASHGGIPSPAAPSAGAAGAVGIEQDDRPAFNHEERTP